MTRFAAQSNNNLSDDDLMLLSAYLDDELTPAEQANLEQRLQTEPALRRELNELSDIRTLLHTLPQAVPPRSFALDSTATSPRRSPWQGWSDLTRGRGQPWRSAWGTLAVLALLIVTSSVLTLSLLGGQVSQVFSTVAEGLNGDSAAPEAAPQTQERAAPAERFADEEAAAGMAEEAAEAEADDTAAMLPAEEAAEEEAAAVDEEMATGPVPDLPPTPGVQGTTTPRLTATLPRPAAAMPAASPAPTQEAAGQEMPAAAQSPDAPAADRPGRMSATPEPTGEPVGTVGMQAGEAETIIVEPDTSSPDTADLALPRGTPSDAGERSDTPQDGGMQLNVNVLLAVVVLVVLGVVGAVLAVWSRQRRQPPGD